MVASLHLAVLWGFAVAQPLYDLLRQYPTFLTAHALGAGDVVALAFILSLVLPGLLVLSIWGVSRLNRAAGWGLYVSLLAALVGAALLPWVGGRLGLPGWAVMAISALLAVAATALYVGHGALRSFVSALTPAILVFPALFLLTEPIAGLAFPERVTGDAAAPAQGKRPPLVMLVFDELPVTALSDARGRIDALRFPNFARLAGDSHWLRNASTIHGRTEVAIPALLTGSVPDLGTQGALPAISENHPGNLFALLEDHYEIFAYEPITQLCQEPRCHDLHARDSGRGVDRRFLEDLAVIYLHRVLPPSVRARLPSIDQGWTAFTSGQSGDPRQGALVAPFDRERSRGVERGFEAVARTIGSTPAPAFHFLHSILPHASYDYLPSGRSYYQYPVGRKQALPNPLGDDFAQLLEVWGPDRVRAAVTYDRFLAQVGYADTLLGTLLDRLREQGIYDDTLIVVTADHGVAIRPGELRREVTPTNYKDILAVPLFVKLPHQAAGSIDDRNVELIDVAPTILQTLALPIPATVEGRPLFDPSAPARADKRAFMAGELRSFPGDLEAFQDYPGIPADRSRPWRPASVPDALASELLGRDPIRYERAPSELEQRWTVEIGSPELYLDLDLEAQILPAQLIGRVISPGSDAAMPDRLTLAIAMHGRIVALTETFRDGANPWFFSAMLPEAALHTSRNEIGVFRVSRGGEGAARLSPLPVVSAAH